MISCSTLAVLRDANAKVGENRKSGGAWGFTVQGWSG